MSVASATTIEITRPEIESLIHERLQSGALRDAEDVILQALEASAPEPRPVFDKQRALAAGARTLAGEYGLTANSGRSGDVPSRGT